MLPALLLLLWVAIMCEADWDPGSYRNGSSWKSGFDNRRAYFCTDLVIMPNRYHRHVSHLWYFFRLVTLLDLRPYLLCWD